MAADLILRTFGDTNRVTDVVERALEILTAQESQIYNMLGKTEARDTVHYYQVDTLKAAAANAVEEGADYTFSARTTPTRLTNIIQNIVVPIGVTRTQQLVNHFTGQNELERQTSKALMEWANDAEFNLVRSTLASGVSGTAPSMSGLIEATSKSTTHTSQTSGTVWAASILDGLMQNCWTNNNANNGAGAPNNLFMGGVLRKNTDAFTQKSNVVVNTPGIMDIVRTVSTYTTAFGELKLHSHRYIQQGSDATARVLAVNTDKLKLAFLERPNIQTDLAVSGDYTKRAVRGKFTVEVHNQDTNFFCDGFLNS